MIDTDVRLERLKAERNHAYEKAADWTAKGKELDRKIMEVENLEILRVVRGMTASPEDLRSVLNMIQAAMQPQSPAQPMQPVQPKHEQEEPIPQERKEEK